MARRDSLLWTIAAALTLLFVVLSALVASGSTLAIDTAIMEAIHRYDSPQIARAFALITALGYASIVVPLVVVVTVGAWIAGDRPAAIVLATVGIADWGVNVLLKLLFQRARPELWPRAPMTSFAYPSGHAMTSVAVYCMLAIVLVRLAPRGRPIALVVAPLIALVVGTSRMVLGVHWPSDVLGGWDAGGLLIILGAIALRRWPSPRSQ